MHVVANDHPHPNYCLLKLTADQALPEMLPGQFVEVLVEGSSTTFLRRPISVHFVDPQANELWLLIQLIGDGTRKLATLQAGDKLNVLLPLGNGFTTSDLQPQSNCLLVGGGVGTAPMLYLGACLKAQGITPNFLLGARSAGDLLQLDHFRSLGPVYLTTEDGSMGEKGFVTNHSVLKEIRFDRIYTCGPKPMMMAVAAYANKCNTPCEASLENLMACGLGACLCCVEKNNEGHNVCVCKEGPVFNTEKLSWQN